MDKKKIWKLKETVDLDYKTIEKAIDYLSSLGDRYGYDAKITWTEGDYDSYSQFYVKTEELETDKEYKSRIENEQRLKSWQEQRDAAEFERLKKKFS